MIFLTSLENILPIILIIALGFFPSAELVF